MTETAKKDFFEEIGSSRDFIRLFDHLDQLSFFLKNSKLEIVSANRNFYSRLGFTEEHQIVGKNDYELFPIPLARKFRRDDQLVLKTGQEMPRMIELFLNRHGIPDWFITNKMPVHNLTGIAVGVMGTVQRYDQKRGLESTDPVVANAVRLMLTNPGEITSVDTFARELGMSHRHFDRRFKEDTGLTPKQFLGRSRIQQACLILRKSDVAIGELAIELGYCDQSAFTAQFRLRMGLTPLKYRKQFGKVH